MTDMTDSTKLIAIRETIDEKIARLTKCHDELLQNMDSFICSEDSFKSLYRSIAEIAGAIIVLKRIFNVGADDYTRMANYIRFQKYNIDNYGTESKTGAFVPSSMEIVKTVLAEIISDYIKK